jgi:hypothetical protein
MLTKSSAPFSVVFKKRAYGFLVAAVLLSLAASTTAALASGAAMPAVLSQGADGLSPRILALALDAVSSAREHGIAGKSDLVTVIDYSLPSTEPRLWVLDLARGKVLFHELVAHGAGSGEKFATRFSNVNDSRATSLGLFLTGETYEGGNGYSLKLKGLDDGINDRAEERHIVMHGAWYVSADHARQYGMLGRSWGCPALPLQDAKSVIDTVKGGSFVFAYSVAAPATLHASLASGPARSSSCTLLDRACCGALLAGPGFHPSCAPLTTSVYSSAISRRLDNGRLGIAALMGRDGSPRRLSVRTATWRKQR